MKKLLWFGVVLAVAAGGGAVFWREQTGRWPNLADVAGLGQVGGPPAGTPAAAGARGRAGSGPALPVTTALAEKRDLPIMLDALGTVQAYATVTIRPQVSGVLLEAPFREGQEVKKGDVIARIDPRTYQASLDQALATKAQHEAQLANARLDLRRYEALARTDGVTRQQADTQRATVAQYEAQVAADQAQIDAARTQLDYTTIRSPIEGRMGLRLTDPGNLVTSGDSTGLVTITQLRPIAITFTLPQQELPRVLAALSAGEVPVEARVRGEQGLLVRGVLETLDNQVDSTTGTIKLKARFENAEAQLWPGAFVNIRLRVATLRQALVIPLVAVQRGPNGPFAFVVQPDMSVKQQALSLGTLTPEFAVVEQGLQPGERVVSSGALRLFDGSRVAPVDASGESAPRGPRPGQGQGQAPRRPVEGAAPRPAP